MIYQLCLKFAKNCLKIEKFKKHFPLNTKLHAMPTRHCEKYALQKKSSERYAKSALPSMIRLLNDYDRRKKEVLKSVSNYELWPLRVSIIVLIKTIIIIIYQ